ncbi:DUF3592 domain-containing protein [Acetivibrio straminisolvens]|jgi:hypothetical protein|uniref:DUF3592 domain-containing protein n=1 Tax=Acetivibrio straminisolvens JCM 21531 TaxID=1294263 RepID=W4VC69_9FIRM|nr:DUF3592 domain-containing protein [Acetivibrio straminisolvens]GAE90797.1 hypothetical protein JCM21531_4436 [Acetivibrio straminisolvens JCM 21531]
MKIKVILKFVIGCHLIILGTVIFTAGFIPNMVRIIERNISNDYYQTTANIVDITERLRGHDVTVSFGIPGGQEYTALLDTYVEGMDVGDSVEIYYKKSNPAKITLKGNQFWQAVIFGPLGGVLLVISIILLKSSAAKFLKEGNIDSLMLMNF